MNLLYANPCGDKSSDKKGNEKRRKNGPHVRGEGKPSGETKSIPITKEQRQYCSRSITKEEAPRK